MNPEEDIHVEPDSYFRRGSAIPNASYSDEHGVRAAVHANAVYDKGGATSAAGSSFTAGILELDNFDERDGYIAVAGGSNSRSNAFFNLVKTTDDAWDLPAGRAPFFFLTPSPTVPQRDPGITYSDVA